MEMNQLQNLFSKNLKNMWADPDLIRELKPANRLSAEQAIEIYHRSYFATLTEELTKTYPAIRWVLGEKLFNEICHKFIDSQPSITYNLLFYGKEFPDFLRSNSSTQKIPFLHDLAQLEWIYKETYHMAPANPMEQDLLLEQTHASDFKVQFIESLKILSSPYAIYELWCRQDEPPYSFELIDWLRHENLLIYKHKKQVRVIQIQAIEAAILKSLENGISLATALADYSGQLTPDQTAQFLQLLKTSGLIEDIFITED